MSDRTTHPSPSNCSLSALTRAERLLCERLRDRTVSALVDKSMRLADTSGSCIASNPNLDGDTTTVDRKVGKAVVSHRSGRITCSKQTSAVHWTSLPDLFRLPFFSRFAFVEPEGCRKDFFQGEGNRQFFRGLPKRFFPGVGQQWRNFVLPTPKL